MNVPAIEPIPALSPAPSLDALENILRQDLANGDAFLGTAAPLLRHFLTNDDDSLFSDDIIARVRGITSDLAVQVLDAMGLYDAAAPDESTAPSSIQAISDAIVSQPALLRHVHALALEWQLTERLQHRLSLDPVISPLIQALVASPEPQVAGTAMKFLASQARFGQNMRRMKLPAAELPGDLLHILTQIMRTSSAEMGIVEDGVVAAEKRIRAEYDEGVGRVALASQLVMGMGPGVLAALSITHAGVALFSSALAHASAQEREVIIHATNERQIARLALSLSAAGAKSAHVEEQVLSLHPDIVLPDGYDRLDADRAAAILASGAPAGQ